MGLLGLRFQVQWFLSRGEGVVKVWGLFFGSFQLVEPKRGHTGQRDDADVEKKVGLAAGPLNRHIFPVLSAPQANGLKEGIVRHPFSSTDPVWVWGSEF